VEVFDKNKANSLSRRSQNQVGFLLVANYEPDVGFAWWLMENFWVRIAQACHSHGIRPILVYPSLGNVPKSIADAKIETIFQPFPGTGLRELVRTLKVIRSNNIRYIYFSDRGFTSWYYIFLRLCGVRKMINHDHTPGDRPPVIGIAGLLKTLRSSLPLVTCDLQISVSPLIRERSIQNARIPHKKTAVVQNGIVPIECAGDRQYAHRQLGLAHEKQICITVGRASSYKRIDFVIQVARYCIHDLGIRDLAFVHCGDGPELSRLEDLIGKSRLTEHFILAGKRADVSALLCSSDYALHAAKGEAFSLAVLEYMSAGLAVLVPNVPTVCQAITHDSTGLVYRDEDVEHAATLLQCLLRDSPRRRQLGVAAAAEVRKKYTLMQMNETFDAMVKNVILPKD
jgi:glycosyltransferase involved in cell wall biosynthesis